MISANSTIMLIVAPNDAMTRIPSRKLPGIDTPTRLAARKPRIPMMTMNTSRTADMTLFCRFDNIWCTSFDLSRDATIVTPSGQ